MVPIPGVMSTDLTRSLSSDGVRATPLQSSVAATAAHTSVAAHLALGDRERFQVRIGAEGRPEEKVAVSRVHVGGGTYAQRVDDTSLDRIQAIFRDLKQLILRGLGSSCEGGLTGGAHAEIKVRVNTATQIATVWVEGGQSKEVDLAKMGDSVRAKVEKLHNETVANFGTQAAKIPFGKVDEGFSGFSSSRSALKGLYFDRNKLPQTLDSYATELLSKRYPNNIEKQKGALTKMVKANTYRDSLLSFIKKKINELNGVLKAHIRASEDEKQEIEKTIRKLREKQKLLEEADMFAIFSAVSHEINETQPASERAETIKQNVENDLKTHLRVTKQYMGIRKDRELSGEEKQYAILVGLAGAQMDRTEQVAFTSKYGLDHREQMKAEELLFNCVFGFASLVQSFFKDIEGEDYIADEFVLENQAIKKYVELQEVAIVNVPTTDLSSYISACLTAVKGVVRPPAVERPSSPVVALESSRPTDPSLDGELLQDNSLTPQPSGATPPV